MEIPTKQDFDELQRQVAGGHEQVDVLKVEVGRFAQRKAAASQRRGSHGSAGGEQDAAGRGG